ncbi:protein kinase [Actinomadura chibensis]|uniref:Protein kinase n=1 Tax=Actinomadura chibensis TaxID=392828 RepID=A0A5D0NBY6_9ACTN|nr:protein kinase [Actinomadura chibensis]
MHGEWRVGERLLGLYEVKGLLGAGGMGVVHRVRHLGWDLDLAVKSPRVELVGADADRRAFSAEAETWVGLGMHPHVCVCHYVRTIDGVPRIFAEYVPGGSLRDWIRDGRLYRGGGRAATARVLDVAIQLAWGLEHAHRRRLTHQDVKPANVLMDPDGTAKVTDFGLAKGLPGGAVGAVGAGPDPSVLVSAGGLTPAYASPEQAAGRRVGRRSDVFSLAVSVLEMITGEVTWATGAAARGVLAGMRPGGGRAAMPTSVTGLLAECLRADPDRRPRAGEVARRLAACYREAIGDQYPRPEPEAASLRADELNNRALSLLDLKREDEALRCFEQARAVEPQHAGAIYNAGLLAWRADRLTDGALIERMAAAVDNADDPAQAKMLLGHIHLERADAATAWPLLREAADKDSRGAAELARLRKETSGSDGWEHLDVITGKTGGVTMLDVAADASVAVTGGYRQSVQVWDLKRRECVRTLKAGEGGAASVALSTDGRYVLCASRGDRKVRWWDLQGDRQDARALKGRHKGVWRVLYDSRESRGVSIGADGTVKLWDLGDRSARELGHAAAAIRGARAVALAGGRILVGGGGGGTVQVHDRDHVAALEGHTGRVVAIDITPDGRHALSADEQGTLRLWDVEERRCLRTLRAPVARLSSVSLSRDARLALTIGRHSDVRLWDLRSGRSRLCPLGDMEAADVRTGRLSANGGHAVYAGSAKSARTAIWVWSIPRGFSRASYRAPFHICRPRAHRELTVTDAKVDRLIRAGRKELGQGNFFEAHDLLVQARLTPGHQRSRLVLDAWNELAQQCVRGRVQGVWPVDLPPQLATAPKSLVVSPDGTTTVCSLHDGTVLIWNCSTGTVETHNPARHGPTWKAVAGDLALASGTGNQLQLWSLSTLERRGLVPGGGYSSWRNTVAVGRTGKYVLTAGGQTVRVWEASSGTEVMRLGGHQEEVSAVCLSRTERVAVSGTAGGYLKVWDLDDAGRCVATLAPYAYAHKPQVTAIALTDDDRHAVASRFSGALCVWDLESGHRRPEITSTENLVDMALEAEGRFALTSAGDGELALWDLSNGWRNHTLITHASTRANVAFSDDGRRAFAWAAHGPLRAWEIDWRIAPYRRPRPSGS